MSSWDIAAWGPIMIAAAITVIVILAFAVMVVVDCYRKPAYPITLMD